MRSEPFQMVDSADFADWIGRGANASERLGPRLIHNFRATLGPYLAEAKVPLGVFWCIAPDVQPAGRLGPDGHALPGISLPPLPLPRRMWAGGNLVFRGGFVPGEEVRRTSVIEAVTFKQGATGLLGFVTLSHRYEQAGGTVLDERQDIVYRTPAIRADAAPAAPAPDLTCASEIFLPDQVLLFRFSALTFNGHRIHYDLPYATGAEGYEGLVVQGPLQAVLLMNLAAKTLGRTPATFTYRGTAPLICGRSARIEAMESGNGGLRLQIRVEDGPITMVADAT